MGKMSKVSLDYLKKELSRNQDEKLDSYLQSPLYYLITGRKGAQLYKNHNAALVVCQHPHSEDRLMVFPEVGKADYELTASVLNMLTPPKNGIQLARYHHDDIRSLREQLAKPDYSTVSGISIIEEDILDWRYPMHIVACNRVGQMQGSKFQKTRNKFRQAAQSITSVELNHQNSLRFMRAALKFWEGNMIANRKDTDDMSSFYEEFFKIAEQYPNTYEGLVFMQGRKPVGLSVWEELSSSIANSFVHISDTTIGGLSDFQLVSTCRMLHARGVRHLNLGGSETHSLNAFKQKYQPVKSAKLLSANVTYVQAANTNIQVHQIV